MDIYCNDRYTHEIKYLAESKPPIFAHLSATLEGLASIHVYHAESRFDAANIEKIDANTKALYAITQGKKLLVFR
jgi:hypothetical protein